MALVLPNSFDLTFTTQEQLTPFTMRSLNYTREFIWLYWADAINLCMEHIDETTQFIGPLSYSPAIGKASIYEAMQDLRKSLPLSYIMTDEHYDYTNLDAQSCSITARNTLERQVDTPLDELSGTHAGMPMQSTTTILATLVWTTGDDQAPHLVSCHCSITPSQEQQAPDAAALSQREVLLSRLGENAIQTVDSNGVSHWFLPMSVIYIKAAHQYTDIFCVGRRVRIRSSFATALEQLGDTVVRVHRSYAVNPAYLSHMQDLTLYLTTGDQIPIPANRRHEVHQLLLEHTSKLGTRG